MLNIQKPYYFIFAAVVVVLILGAVLLFQKISSTSPPGPSQGQPAASLSPTPTISTTNEPTVSAGIPLSITAPSNNSTTSAKTVTVKGKTAPKAEVSVNDKDLKADAQGNFSSTVTLDEGDNYIDIVANDTNGNFAEQEIVVTYETGK